LLFGTPGLFPSDLEPEHQPDAIRRRLEKRDSRYLPSIVLGGVDGGVTTFAIVAAAVGSGLSGVVILVLGFANVLADGFSMAVGSFHAARTEANQIARARQIESHHIDQIPEGETEEVRQILARKGLEGEALERAVQTMTADRRLWIDMMISEEWGLLIHEPVPFKTAAATFGSFLAFGALPLIPFLFFGHEIQWMFRTSMAFTGVAFATVGVLKGIALGSPVVRSGAETLLSGAAAALLAYLAGAVLGNWLGTGL
jgi:VIT1/CCC1 family predicted Fe2+/Mn2+ transporter